MDGQPGESVLRRMVGSNAQATPEIPLTASRAMRIALGRAAQVSVGIPIGVSTVTEEHKSLDDMVATLSDDLMLMALNRGDQLYGLCGLDLSLCTTVGEVQTAGGLSPRAPKVRPMTATDLALAQPLVEWLLRELQQTTKGTVLENWCDRLAVGGRIESARRAGLDLADGTFRVMQMGLDISGGAREGSMLLALPSDVSLLPVEGAAPEITSWADRLRAAVMAAPLSFDAVLHRFPVSLQEITALQPDSLLPLRGCTVGDVQLETLDGRTFAPGRLGQVAGKIAVRLEAKALDELADMPNLSGGEGASPGPDMLSMSDIGSDLGPDLGGDLAPDLGFDAGPGDGLPDLPALGDGAEPEAAPGGDPDLNLGELPALDGDSPMGGEIDLGDLGNLGEGGDLPEIDLDFGAAPLDGGAD